MTPEGFLLCEAVPIARVGEYQYSRQELLGESSLQFRPDGTITVERRAEDVFDPIAMASFEGKPVTIDHPDGFVSPQTWKDHSVGYGHNVRRGEGQEANLLLADLMIQDAEAIGYVNREMPEISNGYDAQYEPIGPGRARQCNIVGNHFALVKRGRAGPRCAIRDHAQLVMPAMEVSAAEINKRNREFYGTG